MRLLVKHEKELVKLYGIEHIDSWPRVERTRRFSITGYDPRLAYIFHAKFDHELAGMLVKTNLAIRDGIDLQIGMHPKLANVYMAALAEVLANHAQASPVTDDAINYFALSGFTLNV